MLYAALQCGVLQYAAQTTQHAVGYDAALQRNMHRNVSGVNISSAL